MKTEFTTRYLIKEISEDGLLKDPKTGSDSESMFDVDGYESNGCAKNAIADRARRDLEWLVDSELDCYDETKFDFVIIEKVTCKMSREHKVKNKKMKGVHNEDDK